MRHLASSLSLGLLLVILSSCYNSTATVTKDPVDEFKVIVARFIPVFKKSYIEDRATRSIPLGPPSIEFEEKSIKFDVKKTDSIVAPLTGKISCDAYFGEVIPFTGGEGTFEFVFAYQDENWVVQSGQLVTGTGFADAGGLVPMQSGYIEFTASSLQSAMQGL